MRRSHILAVIYAVLAALFYAFNVPFSKLLLSYIPPTCMAGLLYQHNHEHSHTFTHTHDGSTHSHTIVHSHNHSHLLRAQTHSHSHPVSELEKWI